MQDEFVMARSCDHRPSVFRGMIASRHLVEKNEIFSAFQILFKQTSNAGECVLQQMRKGFQQCGSVIKIIQHETCAVDEAVTAAMMI